MANVEVITIPYIRRVWGLLKFDVLNMKAPERPDAWEDDPASFLEW